MREAFKIRYRIKTDLDEDTSLIHDIITRHNLRHWWETSILYYIS